MNNDLFPTNFIWGAASSAHQIEGAQYTDGKGASIWDAFASIPGKILNNDSPAVASSHYSHIKTDVALMKSMGLTSYRFSISWPRVIPAGTGEVNEAGIKFYNELIDELLANDITPFVTMYHWDLPLALLMEKDGWLNRDIIQSFLAYADLCFERFGDRVKHWITFNEPWVVAILGYGQGVFAPGRISNIEPYLVGHHILLSHAEAVQLYRTKYNHQNGHIGITNNCDWREPLTSKKEDIEAAERALLFFIGWFADPIWLGDYPQVMKDRLGNRLPAFSEDEKKKLLGSSDFLGLNHYTTMYAAQSEGDIKKVSAFGNGGLSEDQDVELSSDPSWRLTTLNWAVVPWGCTKLLQWLSNRYGNPPIYITENGFTTPDELVDGAVNDQDRIDYTKEYLQACKVAIDSGVDLRGYFHWCILDTFEWTWGYNQKFGLLHVDFETLKRTPKKSASWYAEVIRNNKIV
jgi:beta-galactosidase